MGGQKEIRTCRNRKRAKVLFLVMAVGVCLFCGCAGKKIADDPVKETDEPVESTEPAATKEPEELTYYECDPVEGTYVIIAEGEKNFPEDRLRFSDEAGDLQFSDSHASGTPYDSEGLWFDKEYFSCMEAGSYDGGNDDETGGGYSYYYWKLHALKPGETEAMLLTRYLVDDSLSGTRVRISIGEDLKCYVRWIEYDEEEENFLFFEPDEEIVLPPEKDYQPYSSLSGSYEILREEDKTYGENNNIYMDTDGNLLILDGVEDGESYEITGLWFDEERLSCELAKERLEAEDDEEGGENYYWKLHGLQPGETEVLVLHYFESEDYYEGVQILLSVDDDLKCETEWIDFHEGTVTFTFHDQEENAENS